MTLRLNNVTLAGNIATDITLKPIGQDKQVASFNLAIDNPHKEATYFVACEVWGKTAGNLHKFCRKGSAIYLEGCIVIDQYEKDGQKRSITKISCDRIQFLDSKQKSEERAGGFPMNFQGHPNTPEPSQQPGGWYPQDDQAPPDQGHVFDPKNPFRWENVQDLDKDLPFDTDDWRP
jgi:single-strand DNA-binding protein